MIHRIRKQVLGLGAALVAAGALLLSAAESRAGLVLQLGDGNPANSVVVSGGPVVSYNGAVGNFIINVTTGISLSQIDGDSSNPRIDLNSVDLSMGGGVLTIALTETGLTGTPMGPGLAAFLTSIGGTTGAGSSVSVSTYLDLQNDVFDINTGTGGTDILLSSLNGLTGAFSAVDGSEVYNTSGPFSLTTIITINHSGQSPITASSFNVTLEALPEPAAASVWGGIAALVCGGAAFRRWRGRTD